MEDDMMERLFAILLASALVAPQTATANDSKLTNDGSPKATTDNLHFPPIPYLDTMPWLGFGADSKNPGVGTLPLPAIDASPILKNPSFAAGNVGKETKFDTPGK
jgi:hypothetical protein